MAATALEQMFLELLNAARLDPRGDAARYIVSYDPLQGATPDIQNALDQFQVSGTMLRDQFEALAPAQPLAWNDQLAAAARKHNQAMIAADTQSHQLPGEPNLGVRLINEGYDYTRFAENVYAYCVDPLFGHAGFMVDWGYDEGGMQSPAAHRENILDPNLREVGIGVTREDDPDTALGPLVVTQDFGRRDTAGVFILGVAYRDSDGDDFYSIGEGRSGLRVSLGEEQAVSAASGGYALETYALGAQTITLTGGGLAGAVTVKTVLADGTGVKLDVIDGDTLHTSVSGTISGPVTTVAALGLTGLTLTTNGGAQTLAGTKGDDTLSSGSGNDTVSGGAGSDRMAGGTGNDTYFVDSPGDTVTELASSGSDIVRSAISYTLPAHVEKLILTGSGDIDGSGSAQNNTIAGNSGDNVLDGGGGADTLKGSGGSDTLVWSASAILLDGGSGTDKLELAGAGTDLNLIGLPQGTITSVERIDLTGSGDNTLTLNAQEVLDLSSNDTLRVLGDAGDVVHRGGGWTAGADREIGGHTYDSYTRGLATLLVDSDITSLV